MARLRAILSYEYEADPENYPAGVGPDVMASIDRESLQIDPEVILAHMDDVNVRVKVVCE